MRLLEQVVVGRGSGVEQPPMPASAAQRRATPPRSTQSFLTGSGTCFSPPFFGGGPDPAAPMASLRLYNAQPPAASTFAGPPAW